VGDTLVRLRETAERALETAHSLNSLLQGGGVKSDPRLAQVVVRTEALKSTAADLLLEIKQLEAKPRTTTREPD
jgi:hypothetical protein